MELCFLSGESKDLDLHHLPSELQPFWVRPHCCLWQCPLWDRRTSAPSGEDPGCSSLPPTVAFLPTRAGFRTTTSSPTRPKTPSAFDSCVTPHWWLWRSRLLHWAVRGHCPQCRPFSYHLLESVSAIPQLSPKTHQLPAGWRK